MTRASAKPSPLLPAILACALVACSHAPPRPAGYQWGLPVYPGATVAGRSTAKASFVLYRTDDDVAMVDAWYVAELPKNASHAYDAVQGRSTLALFDARGRRTVHIERHGSVTSIMLTSLANP